MAESGNRTNPLSHSNVVKIISGQCQVSSKADDVMVTILGSCISACIRDPIVKVGGMNHFLLPSSIDAKDTPLRYGSYAMEQLINDILKRGGNRNNLEIKIFGGGHVMQSSSMIGEKNIEFIRRYLKDEGFKISQEDLGGEHPRKVHYYPHSGKVMMLKINKISDVKAVEEEEKAYSKVINNITEHENDDDKDVELF